MAHGDYSNYIKKDPGIERLAAMRENMGNLSTTPDSFLVYSLSYLSLITIFCTCLHFFRHLLPNDSKESTYRWIQGICYLSIKLFRRRSLHGKRRINYYYLSYSLSLSLFKCWTEMKLGKEPIQYLGRCWICPPNAEELNADPANWLNRIDR